MMKKTTQFTGAIILFVLINIGLISLVEAAPGLCRPQKTHRFRCLALS